MPKVMDAKDTLPSVSLPMMDGGKVIPFNVQRKIRADLITGTNPQVATIARRNGVSSTFVHKMLDNDPELKETFATAVRETGEMIENEAIDMCLDKELNPVARGKLIEFMLSKMIPEKYGENAGLGDAAKTLPKFNITLNLPVLEKKQEIIEVKSDSPL